MYTQRLQCTFVILAPTLNAQHLLLKSIMFMWQCFPKFTFTFTGSFSFHVYKIIVRKYINDFCTLLENSSLYKINSLFNINMQFYSGIVQHPKQYKKYTLFKNG